MPAKKNQENLKTPVKGLLPFFSTLLQLGRPKFLIYSMVLFGLGTVAAAQSGVPLNFSLYLQGQLFISLTHLMTHYCNEYFDLDADRANPAPTSWTGGSRILVERILPPSVSLATAHILLFCALGIGFALPTATARWMTFVILTLAWFYTAPPLRFNYRGLGEATVAVVLNGITPLLAFQLQTQTLSLSLIQVLIPTAIIQYVRMLVMNLSDIDGDRLVGKKTLVVFLGPKRAILLITLGQLIAYGSILLLALGTDLRPAGITMLLTAPLSIWLVWRLFHGAIRNPKQANSVVFWASTHVALTFASAMLGLMITALLERQKAVLPLLDSYAVLCAVILSMFAIHLSAQLSKSS